MTCEPQFRAISTESSLLCESMTYTSPAPRSDSRQRLRLCPSFLTGIITLTGRLGAGDALGTSAARTVDSGSLHKGAAISAIGWILRSSYWMQGSGKARGECTTLYSTVNRASSILCPWHASQVLLL